MLEIEQLDSLLTKEEKKAGKPVPAQVVHTATKLSSMGVWFKISRNRGKRKGPVCEAGNCKDAAGKRSRLGSQGIELWNEFKSYFGRYLNRKGEKHYFAAHCRGDRRIDELLLQKRLGAETPVERVDELILKEKLGMAHGLVTPFESWKQCNQDMPVVQIFDNEIRSSIGECGTMVTNAGDKTWAVEFDAIAYSTNCGNRIFGDISAPVVDKKGRVWGARKPKTIGIITGNPPEAGISLWRRINKSVKAHLGADFCGDVSLPNVVVHSMPVLGLTMEIEERAAFIWPSMAEHIETMCSQGIDVLAIPCHTTHRFRDQISELCRVFGVQFVDLPEVVCKELKNRKTEIASIVGIRSVADTKNGPYAGPIERNKIVCDEVINSDLEALCELAYDYKSSVSANLQQPFNQILKSVKDKPNETVVLALTELSLIYENMKTSNKRDFIVDPLDLYANQIVSEYFK